MIKTVLKYEREGEDNILTLRLEGAKYPILFQMITDKQLKIEEDKNSYVEPDQVSINVKMQSQYLFFTVDEYKDSSKKEATCQMEK